ncbi:hypothetical protein [Siphonobacter sp.]|uniref:hypothetical protein n=1 Tax=Siphonobacter sp. TaxID=1869184 RepID=UPI003B3A4782
MSYLIKSVESGFEIYSEAENPVVTFTYDSWFSSIGQAEVNQRKLKIKSKNAWASKFDVFIDDVDQGDIVFNWMGQIIIRLSVDGPEKVYLLKSRGVWNHHFILEDTEGITLMLIIPKYNWSNLNYEYQLKIEGNQAVPLELVTSCQYAINLYMTMLTTAAAT